MDTMKRTHFKLPAISLLLRGLLAQDVDCKFRLFHEPMTRGSVLLPSEYFCSYRTTRYVFGMDTMGDLVLQDLDTDTKVWSAGTTGASYALLDENGSFDVYNTDNDIVWSANTKGGNHVYFHVSPLYVAVGEDREPSSTAVEYWRSDGDGGGLYGGGPCTVGRWEELRVGDVLRNREYKCHSKDVVFGVNEEGNLGLFNVSGVDPIPLWSAETTGDNVTAGLDGSGRLSVYSESSGDRVLLWHSDTRGGTEVEVEGDTVETSYASIVDSSGTVAMTYWRSDTPGHLLHGGGRCKFGWNTNTDFVRGDYLEQGELFCSYQNIVLGFDDGGDLALFYMDEGEMKKIWCAGTSGQNNAFRLSPDGDLEVYDALSGELLWTQPTSPDTQWIEIKEDFINPENSLIRGKEGYQQLTEFAVRTVWDSSDMPTCSAPSYTSSLVDLLMEFLSTVLCVLIGCESNPDST